MAAPRATADRQEVERVILNLPEPPSANELFANISHARRAAAAVRGQKLPGRMKTAAYRTWENAACWLLASQRPGRVAGPYQIEIAVARSGKDLGNLEKALSDLLVTHGVVDDDARAERITLEWSDALPARQLRVIVRAHGSVRSSAVAA